MAELGAINGVNDEDVWLASRVGGQIAHVQSG